DTTRRNSMTRFRRGLISSAHASRLATLAEEGCVTHMATKIKRWTLEILSPYARRRDHMQKRSLYIDAGVEEYWIVDPEENTITSIRAERADVVSRDQLVWAPTGAEATLTLDIASIFG